MPLLVEAWLILSVPVSMSLSDLRVSSDLIGLTEVKQLLLVVEWVVQILNRQTS